MIKRIIEFFTRYKYDYKVFVYISPLDFTSHKRMMEDDGWQLCKQHTWDYAKYRKRKVEYT